MSRPVALLTGLGREIGIAAGIAKRLAHDGFDIAFVFNGDYDATINGGAGDIPSIQAGLEAAGARTVAIDADLSDPLVAPGLFDRAGELGPVSALVLSHAHSTNAGILTETVENFQRHFDVNTRGNWLLIREFGLRFPVTGIEHGSIVALTSDAIVNEIAYGASKAALDRIAFAAAHEFGPLGISVNLVNPGPVDTGWMTPDVHDLLQFQTPAGRLGTPADVAALVAFLVSPEGAWVSGQLIKTDGGYSALRSV